MLGLLAIGVALILGVAMKIAAAGTLLLVLTWSAEWPLAQFTSAGEATGSSNPFVDSHLIYALAMIVLAIIGAGRILRRGCAESDPGSQQKWSHSLVSYLNERPAATSVRSRINTTGAIGLPPAVARGRTHAPLTISTPGWDHTVPCAANSELPLADSPPCP